MEIPTIAIGQYSEIENAIYFKDGKEHRFKGSMLTRLSAAERYLQIRQWALFKGLIQPDEEIVVPGFSRESLEDDNGFSK